MSSIQQCAGEFWLVSVISNVRIDEVLVLIKLTDSFLSVLDAVLIIGAWSGPKYFAKGESVQ